MKSSRFNYFYRENASLLHQKIGECLRTQNSIFHNYKIYQEYPVNKINPSYNNPLHKFDWVILDIKLVIEGHGKQHFIPTSFKKEDKEETLEKHIDLQYRDKQKEQAALNAGFTYLYIQYDEIDLITDDFIWQKYLINKNISNKIDINQKPNTIKNKIKEQRKKIYEKKKQYLKERDINASQVNRYTKNNSKTSN